MNRMLKTALPLGVILFLFAFLSSESTVTGAAVTDSVKGPLTGFLAVMLVAGIVLMFAGEFDWVKR